jgi:hypothetical protein
MRDDRDLAREPGPQPDPMLSERRISPAWIWTIALVCVALVVAVLIAISPPLTNTADVVNGRTTGAAATTTTGPQSAMPSSRSGSGGSTTPPVARPLTDERGNTTGSGNVAR